MSVRRYENCRDSGVDWLGLVPSEWSIQPLKTIAGFTNGEAFKPSEWDDEGTPIIRIQNLNGGDEFNHFKGSVDPRYHVFAGDLLFGWSGNRGTSFGPFKWPRAGLHYLNQHIFKVDSRSAHPGWLYWCLKAVTQYVEQQAHGIIGMVHVTQGKLGASAVPLPSKQEQAAIAAFLDRETDKIDALVEEQRRLIELLKEKRQAVISHAVTKGLAPSAPMKNSGVEWLGEVPAHWEVTRVANVFNEIADPMTEDLPVLSVSIHHGVSDDELDDIDLERKVSRSEDRSKYKRVRPNDLVYNMMRAWQGGFGTVLVDGGVSPAYVVARPKGAIETSFVEWLLRTPQCVEEMRTRSVGVTDFRLRLYWDEFKDLRLAVPPLAEQRRIIEAVGSQVEHYRALSEAAEEAIGLLAERRAALISAAVTGKIDVRDQAAAPAQLESA